MIDMCAFCASVPVVAALGVSMQAKQRARQASSAQAGQGRPVELPIKQITLVTVGALVVGSAITHSRMNF
jgi:plastocyanin domain-containing protein